MTDISDLFAKQEFRFNSLLDVHALSSRYLEERASKTPDLPDGMVLFGALSRNKADGSTDLSYSNGGREGPLEAEDIHDIVDRLLRVGFADSDPFGVFALIVDSSNSEAGRTGYHLIVVLDSDATMLLSSIGSFVIIRSTHDMSPPADDNFRGRFGYEDLSPEEVEQDEVLRLFRSELARLS